MISRHCRGSGLSELDRRRAPENTSPKEMIKRIEVHQPREQEPVCGLRRKYAVESAPHLDPLPTPSGERRARAHQFRVRHLMATKRHRKHKTRNFETGQSSLLW